jgi:hypothetical protein
MSVDLNDSIDSVESKALPSLAGKELSSSAALPKSPNELNYTDGKGGGRE